MKQKKYDKIYFFSLVIQQIAMFILVISPFFGRHMMDVIEGGFLVVLVSGFVIFITALVEYFWD